MEQTILKITTANPEEATIIIEILAEIRRATEKHPVWPVDAVSRAAIVSEEAGEVIREANHIREGHGDLKLLRDELIQTAGVCIRMLNIMDGERLNYQTINRLVRHGDQTTEIIHTDLSVDEITAMLESKKGNGLGAYFPELNSKIKFSNNH